MDIAIGFLAVAAVAFLGALAARAFLRRRRIRQKMAERADAIARENGGR
jgi:hypothetical protein